MGKIHYARVIKTLLYRFFPPRNRFCALCNHKLYAFLPYQSGRYKIPSLMQVTEHVGSDITQFECPWCGSHDRERHLYLYMKAAEILQGLTDKSIIHFAAEKRLSQQIASARPAHYVKCDLFPQTPDTVKVDLLDMPFPDSSFDLLIANHVMEHVADDQLALQEIYRVLKPGGYAIVQTPYSQKLHKTWSDPGINDDASRLQAYGQEDHARLYGRDIFSRFASTGLVSKTRSHQEVLPDVRAEVFGINEREPFMLFQRPLAATNN